MVGNTTMATTSIDQSLSIVREFNESVFNNREYDKLYDLQSEEYVQHGPMTDMELHGNDESLETMKMFHAAFSDLESTEEFAFSDGEYVCTHYTYRGTHDGDFMGIPPTDVKGEISGTVINHIEKGKIAETWVVVDLLGLLQQLEVVPALDNRPA